MVIMMPSFSRTLLLRFFSSLQNKQKKLDNWIKQNLTIQKYYLLWYWWFLGHVILLYEVLYSGRLLWIVIDLIPVWLELFSLLPHLNRNCELVQANSLNMRREEIRSVRGAFWKLEWHHGERDHSWITENNMIFQNVSFLVVLSCLHEIEVDSAVHEFGSGSKFANEVKIFFEDLIHFGWVGLPIESLSGVERVSTLGNIRWSSDMLVLVEYRERGCSNHSCECNEFPCWTALIPRI